MSPKDGQLRLSEFLRCNSAAGAALTAEVVASPTALRTVSMSRAEFDKQLAGALTVPDLVRISIVARAGGSNANHQLASYHSVSTVEEAPEPAKQEAAPAVQQPSGGRSIFGMRVLSCYNRRYVTWALLVLIMDLCWSAILLPISIGFQVSDLELTWACFVDLVAGAICAVELVLGFHVSFVATSGSRRREVTDGRLIATYYLWSGSFWQDLLCTALWVTQIVLLALSQSGVTMQASVSVFQIVRIIRMVRFLAVLRNLFALTVGAGGGSALTWRLRISPRLAHVAHVVFGFAVLLNFFTCVMNFIAIKENYVNTWLNPVAALVRQYGTTGSSALTPAELEAIPAPRRFLEGLYFTLVTVGTLGYGDVTPSTAVETGVVIVMIILGVLLFGLVMGSLADFVGSSNKQAQRAQLFRNKMGAVDSWLHSSTLPNSLQIKIRLFYADIWLRHEGAACASMPELFAELPHKIRAEVAAAVNRPVLARVVPFEGLEEGLLAALAACCTPIDVPPGQELALPGDLADRVWLLHEGEIQVVDEQGGEAALRGPTCVGAAALLQQGQPELCVRRCGLRTATEACLWELHLRDIFLLLGRRPGALEVVLARAARSLAKGEAPPELLLTPADGAEQALGDEEDSTASPGITSSWRQAGSTAPTIPTASSTGPLHALLSQQADPSTPVTWGELQQVTLALHQELLGRLDRLLEHSTAWRAGEAPAGLSASLPPYLVAGSDRSHSRRRTAVHGERWHQSPSGSMPHSKTWQYGSIV